MKQRHSLAAILVLGVLLGGACQSSARTLTVSAAADLSDAFSEIGRLYTAESGVGVSFNFGSTGQLAHQVELGAPVDIFAAASLDYILDLEKKGSLIPGSRQVYGVGRLVIWSRIDSPVKVAQIQDLNQAAVKRIAIANPEHAPYGKAAREAFVAAGVWPELLPRIVMAGNVREALQYAESGDVDVAIIARSLCQPEANPGRATGNWSLVPDSLHHPLIQALGIVSGTQNRELAEKFTGLVASEKGKQILSRYGFSIQSGEAAQ